MFSDLSAAQGRYPSTLYNVRYTGQIFLLICFKEQPDKAYAG